MSALGDRDAAARKAAPIARGVLWYFPDAILQITTDGPGEWSVGEEPDSPAMLAARLLNHNTSDCRVESAATIAINALDILLAELGHDVLNDPLPLAEFITVYAPALAEIAGVSLIGAQQHCGGVLGWAREKSTDHADCIVRHFVDRGTFDTDGGLHSAKVAWRALALLQTEIEAAR